MSRLAFCESFAREITKHGSGMDEDVATVLDIVVEAGDTLYSLVYVIIFLLSIEYTDLAMEGNNENWLDWNTKRILKYHPSIFHD